MTFGERLKLAIKEHGENQSEFSKKIGLSNRQTFYNISNDHRGPSFEMLQKIIYGLPMTNARWLILGAVEEWDKWIKPVVENLQQERKEENEVQG